MTNATASASGPQAVEGSPLPGPSAQLAAEPADEQDLRALLQRVLESGMQMAAAQAGVVRVLSDAGDRLQMVGQRGLPEQVARAEQSIAVPVGAAGRAQAGDTVAWVDDELRSPHASRDGTGGHDRSRVLALLLSHQGRVFGLINLYFGGDTAPDAATLALLKCVGELLGLALNNAHREREKLGVALALERQVMAAEVHDSVAQNLAFVKMRMPLLHDAITAQDNASALRYCDEVRQAVSGANTNLRQLLGEFRAPVDPLGLKHALRSCILMFAQHTQVTLDFDDQAPELHLSLTQESQVFHIVQESLANIAKHARAQRAWLSIAQRGERVDVIVDDDGSGATASTDVAQFNHFGLDIMRQRAQRLGGRIEIGPREGGGTRVHLSFPLANDPLAAAP